MKLFQKNLDNLFEIVDDFVREVDAELNLTKYRICAEMSIDRYRGCTLTFKVGAEKLYVIKNISEFLVHVTSKDRVRYGKNCEFVHSMDAFDEASRERFIYPYMEQSSYSTIDFIKRAIVYFGYKPKIIQTDNGFEFTHGAKTDRIHPFDVLCNSLNIEHKLIKPRTPRHNGKVERSHRNDQQRFYNYLSFYSYDDLIYQMKFYLKRSNNIPMQILGWLSPIQKREQLKSNIQ